MAVSLKDSLITVWRVENTNGEGPFHPSQKSVESVLCSSGFGLNGSRVEGNTPAAANDPKLYKIWQEVLSYGDKAGWVFGFKSPEHYQLWFGDADIQEAFACADFSLNRYQIDPQFVHEGTNQCLFWRSAAIQHFEQ